jgi:predicted RecB family nuclease
LLSFTGSKNKRAVSVSIRLNPNHFTILHSPSHCIKRLYLKYKDFEAAPPGAFEQLLFELGKRHEKLHLSSFPFYEDLTGKPLEKTLEELKKETPVICQGTLCYKTVINGQEAEVTGIPDFIIREEKGYVIRECKLALNVSEKRHPEAFSQLQVYAWLLEKITGQEPIRLEVFLGDRRIEMFEYKGEDFVLDRLNSLVEIVTLKNIPYSPVGWSKCAGCGYHSRCWKEAYKEHDVALVYGVDQNLVTALREKGTATIEEMMKHFDRESLSDFKRPWGEKEQKVGKKAGSILLQAEAMRDKKEIFLKEPELPHLPNYVMFDLEGLPPQFDELEKIYLWGMQVFGESPGPYQYALAGMGEEGDSKGWEDFLNVAEEIFNRFGDIPFVHWHSYEKTKINLYKERYGDRDGIASRVLLNLLDLLVVTKKSIVLPEPSYSLKVVEKYIGYKRTQEEFGGEWSIAKYIEAVETEDEKKRTSLISEILKYNKEDLQATWAVFEWLNKKEADGL